MIIAPMPPAIMNFRDDFNVSDSSDIGANWRQDLNNLEIATNRAQARNLISNQVRSGNWESYVASSGYNGGRLLTDNWAVEAQLIAPTGTASGNDFSSIGAAMMDTIGSGMVLVYYTFSTSGNSAIVTYANSSIAAPGTSSGQTGQTTRSGSGGNVANTALVRLERRMYSATASVFTAYVNGSSVASWNDSGGVVAAGDRTKRRWFLQSESDSLFAAFTNRGGAFDWARAYDLKS